MVALFFLVHKTQFMSVDSKTTSTTTQLTAYTTSMSHTSPQRTATVPIPSHGALRIPESLEHGSEVNDCRRGKRAASLSVNSCGWHVGDEVHDHELQTDQRRQTSRRLRRSSGIRRALSCFIWPHSPNRSKCYAAFWPTFPSYASCATALRIE